MLEVDDIIVVDNLAAHHGEAERVLRDFLNDIGIKLLFLPVYSLDPNPVEEVFSKLKYLLKYRHKDFVFENLEYAVLRADGDITAATVMFELQVTSPGDNKNSNLKYITKTPDYKNFICKSSLTGGREDLLRRVRARTTTGM